MHANQNARAFPIPFTFAGISTHSILSILSMFVADKIAHSFFCNSVRPAQYNTQHNAHTFAIAYTLFPYFPIKIGAFLTFLPPKRRTKRLATAKSDVAGCHVVILPALLYRPSNKCIYTVHNTQHVFRISQLCRTTGDVPVSFPFHFNSIFHQFHFIWVLHFYNLTFCHAHCMPVPLNVCLFIHSFIHSCVRSFVWPCACVCMYLFAIFVDSFPLATCFVFI